MDADTAIGGPSGRFPETSATALAQAGCSDGSVRRVGHEAIVAAYWKPVYKYIRFKWREPNETAKDLTQAFFACAIEKDLFAGYDPEQAAFRTFLRLCADRFVINQREHAARLKRSAGTLESLDESMPAAECDPVEYFHREWVRQMFALAVESLKQEYARRGRSAAFRAFELYDLAGDDRPSYAAIAAELALPISQVTNFLAAARRDFRRTVLDRLRELTVTDREFRAEVRAVLGVEL
jgi:DNA-directed RNA polymerase specialized sigma24 family protein